ncbi:MAG: hypothetical protein WDN24_10825 [Sphingomonas sp.]
MRKWMAALVVTAIAGIGASAMAQDEVAPPERELAGLVAGTPTDCITTYMGAATNHGTAILFRERDVIYRSVASGKACGNGANSRVVWMTANGKLCRGQTVRVLDSERYDAGTCRMGAFVPYTKPTG